MRQEFEFQENVPLDILSGPGGSDEMARAARDVDLPSRRADDFTCQRLPLRRRTWTQQRSAAVQDAVENLPSRNGADMSAGESMPSHYPSVGRRTEGSGLEHHATQIVSEMERDQTLMEDNPQAEQLRMETLREMPESLTLKRSIRRKLVKTVSQKSKRSPIGPWKRIKYGCSMSVARTNLALKNVLYSFELWYQGLKVIEGHFGSGVATYFKFLRWLFILDLVVCVMSVSFVVVPQMLYRFYEPHDSNRTLGMTLYEDINTTDSVLVSVTPLPVTFPFPQFRETRSVPAISVETERPLVVRQNPYKANIDFSFWDIFTGEGFFTNTTLYYGYYANDSVHLTSTAWYSIPNAYFFTSLSCYLFLFVALSISMARSYRRSFIETSGGLKNVYAHKIFCGWDFRIATSEAARLKSKSIYNELKELLGDASIDREERSFKTLFNALAIQVSLNVLCLVIILGTAVLMWFLLGNHGRAEGESRGHVMLVSLVVTVIMLLAPILFSWFLRFEGYRNPRTALYVTLLRTFLLEVAVVGVLVAFWLQQTVTGCWETSLGQEAYRLILVDFIFTIVGTALAEFARSQTYKRFLPAIGAPEFDIARNTLSLIYNQTLFWVGAFFSPLLSVIIVVKMFVTFYIKKLCLLKNCQPSTRSWRAAQTHTVFLVLSFLSLLGVVMTYGYIMTQVRTSEDCGPFRGYDYMYQMVLEGVFQLQKNNSFWKLIMFLTKPGVMAGLLLAMCVGVYYLRAKSHARQQMVLLLREMLVLEARDKEFLLSNISKVTDGRWMYNLQRGRPQDPNAPPLSVSSGAAGGDHAGVDPRYRGSSSTLTSQDWRQSGETSTPDAVSSIGSVGPHQLSADPRRSLHLNSRLHQVRSDTSVLPTSSSDSALRFQQHSMLRATSSDDTLHYPDRSDESYLASDDGLNDYDGTRIRNMRNKHIYEQDETEGAQSGRPRRF